MIRSTAVLGLTTCVCLAVAVRHVDAQFTTIINLPPDSLPDQIESNTQINLLPGGEVPDSFDFPIASPDVMNVEVNLDGGLIGRSVRAAGAVVNVHAGRIEWGFEAVNGTIVNVSGGAIGHHMRLSTGRVLNLTGGAVESNLDAFNNTTINLSGGQIDTSEMWEGSLLNMTGGVIAARVNALPAGRLARFPTFFRQVYRLQTARCATLRS